ncbi:recombinase family protein [Methylobacterium haplocladii]|uniref:Resolvase/invertase-type recombinase catalytic domain-containing protein n=1 Tax=Methylobacterium haplocladii TaxID=1176176 RepID=A0A512IS55_9HYPH|nr:recombinase family protein [Methylobacterium haplocladii]GEP00537.1 hypothetical protein MHA02_29240 [Methylobacterium haplocladii]GJD85452.1 hypothetical protein HPGCJGGD_3341 [Methylobacterium haplocladii]GLS57837.1 hypothetical protein GCM10007887_04930 [Methylobacterium haplocladii]
MSEIYVGDAFPDGKVLADFEVRRQAHRAAPAAHRRMAIGYVAGGSASVDGERAVRAFAERHGLELVEVVREAVGAMVAKPTSRPGFANVYGAAEAGRFGTLLVSRAADLSGHAFAAAEAVADLLDLFGVVIRSVSEPEIDTSTEAGKQALADRSGLIVPS